jgi:hypothetical protein
MSNERNEFQVPPIDEGGTFFVERLSTLVEFAQSKGCALEDVIVTYSGNPFEPVKLVAI